MSNRGEMHAEMRKEHLPEIQQFLKDADLKYEFIHGFEWHIRVENAIDIFPTRNRYHILSTDERGSFIDYEDLGRVFLENIESEL